MNSLGSGGRNTKAWRRAITAGFPEIARRTLQLAAPRGFAPLVAEEHAAACCLTLGFVAVLDAAEAKASAPPGVDQATRLANMFEAVKTGIKASRAAASGSGSGGGGGGGVAGGGNPPCSLTIASEGGAVPLLCAAAQAGVGEAFPALMQMTWSGALLPGDERTAVARLAIATEAARCGIADVAVATLRNPKPKRSEGIPSYGHLTGAAFVITALCQQKLLSVEQREAAAKAVDVARAAKVHCRTARPGQPQWDAPAPDEENVSAESALQMAALILRVSKGGGSPGGSPNGSPGGGGAVVPMPATPQQRQAGGAGSRPRRECRACGKQGGAELKVCTGCKVAYFCGAECQMRAWKQLGHKAECKAAQKRREKDEEGGQKKKPQKG